MSNELKVGERVALAMRRGVVMRVSDHGFWIQLDGKPEDHQTWVDRGEPWLEERLEVPEPTDLRGAIEHAVNRFSAENGSNTPDFILAEYLVDCLAAFDKTVKRRADWYGRMDHPCADRPTVNPSEPPK